jgi:hypothetical protein
VVAVLILAEIFFIYNLLPLWHTDIWGHLKYGQWIVEHHGLPPHEPFCPFADKQADYLHFQWLTQTAFYLLYAAGDALAGGDDLRRLEGGVELLRTGHLALTLLCFTLLFVAFWRQAGSPRVACVGLLILQLLGPNLLALLRPQVVGQVLFAALLVPLSRPVLSRRGLVVIPLLFVLWANAHGSFAVGLVVLTLCLAGRAAEAWRAAGFSPAVGASPNDGEKPRRSLSPGHRLLEAWRALRGDVQARRLLVALLVSVAVVAVANPHGPFLYRDMLQFGRHPNLRDLKEWQPLPLRLEGGPQGPFLVSLLVLAVSRALSPRRFTPAQLLLLVVFGVWTCLQQRMLTWWLMLVPWLAAPLWAAAGERLTRSRLLVPSVPTLRKTVLAAALALPLLLLSGPGRWLLTGRPRPLDQAVVRGTPWRLAAQLKAPAGASSDWLPALAQALRASYPEGRFRGSIFPSETQGDYLLWALPADQPVFVYTHVHLFSPEHWAECLTVKFAEPGWRQVLDRHAVNLVVVEPQIHPQLADCLRRDPDWQIVLDESAGLPPGDPWSRTLVALRKHPLPPEPAKEQSPG